MARDQVKKTEKIQKLYRENTDFKRYVDRYCRSRVITVGEALRHDLVREVGTYYIMEQEHEVKLKSWKDQFTQRFLCVV